ncbi:MAG: hypothetical protein M3N34_01695 [Pseudomonadota bacterium]|nr:hypothetical protein [Pseudomonadota bacterium]
MLLVRCAQFRLLCFKDKAAALVKIDRPGVAARPTAGHRTFELVIAQHPRLGHAGNGQVHRAAKVIDELAVIRTLRAAGHTQPLANKRRNIHPSDNPHGPS